MIRSIRSLLSGDSNYGQMLHANSRFLLFCVVLFETRNGILSVVIGLLRHLFPMHVSAVFRKSFYRSMQVGWLGIDNFFKAPLVNRMGGNPRVRAHVNIILMESLPRQQTPSSYTQLQGYDICFRIHISGKGIHHNSIVSNQHLLVYAVKTATPPSRLILLASPYFCGIFGA